MIVNPLRYAKCPHCGAKFDPMHDDAEFDSFSQEYTAGIIIERESRHCSKCGQMFYTFEMFKRKKYKISKTKMW